MMTKVIGDFEKPKPQLIISGSPNSYVAPGIHTIPMDKWRSTLADIIKHNPTLEFIRNENTWFNDDIIRQTDFFDTKLLGATIIKESTGKMAKKYALCHLIQNEKINTISLLASGCFPAYIALTHLASISTLPDGLLVGLCGCLSLVPTLTIATFLRRNARSTKIVLDELFDKVCGPRSIARITNSTIHFDMYDNTGKDVINRTYLEFKKAFAYVVYDDHKIFNIRAQDINHYVDSVERYVQKKTGQNEPIIFNNKLSWKITHNTIVNTFKSYAKGHDILGTLSNSNGALKLALGSLFPIAIAGSCGVPIVALPAIASMYPVYWILNHNSVIGRMLRYYEQAALDNDDQRHIFNKDDISIYDINGNLNVVKHLITMSNGDIDKPYGCYDETLLHFAVREGWLHIVRYLVGLGANVNTADRFKGTPLHTAADMGNVNMLKYLIGQWADVNSDLYSEPPIFRAIRFGNIEAVKCLFVNGANIYQQDEHGRNALIFASVMAKHSDEHKIIDRLLKSEASRNKLEPYA